ncbi:MAG: hypothetical protein HXS44_08615 [Theionarchaea archaeon]|nr:hypothetical protein [Theionarchaea archaeon]
MKISEILGKSLDIVAAQPGIIVVYIVPAILTLIAMWQKISNVVDWGMGRLSSLRSGPLEYFENLIKFIRLVRIEVWLVWVIALVVLAICVGLTIVMSNAHLSGRRMKIGEAFDAISGKLPIFIVAFLICWFLKFVGMFFFWIGILVPAVLLIFVGQAILLDNKDIFDSFSTSYDLARARWFDILLLLLVFLVVMAILRLVPVLGLLVIIFLAGYSAIVFTVMYKDRGRVAPRRAPAREPASG